MASRCRLSHFTTTDTPLCNGCYQADTMGAAQVPAPLAHILVTAVTLAPLVVPIPANLNICATAAALVLCGSLRSVKDEAPTESMTRKVSASSSAETIHCTAANERPTIKAHSNLNDT
jgi:hypothetical protein